MFSRRSTAKEQKSGIHQEAEHLGKSLAPLMIVAERIAATVSQGGHGQRRVGLGEAFWQFRRYEFGDPVQAVDWRKSAKSDPVYVRETEWEGAQSIWLWRDASPSMSFKSKQSLRTKGEETDLLILALSILSARGGERIALLGSDALPCSGQLALRRILTAIENNQAPVASLPCLQNLSKNSRLVMIGDFLSPLNQIEDVIVHFASLGVCGYLIQVLDPAEEFLPYDGRILFSDIEGEGEVMISHVESMRNEYQAELENHRFGINEICRRFAWGFISHRTDQVPEHALSALCSQLSANPKA